MIKQLLLLSLLLVGCVRSVQFLTDYRNSVLRSNPTVYFRFEESSDATKVYSTTFPRLTGVPSTTGSGRVEIGVSDAVAASHGIRISPTAGQDLTVHLNATDIRVAIDTPELAALMPQTNRSWTLEQWIKWDGSVTGSPYKVLFRHRGQVGSTFPSGITAYLKNSAIQCWVGDGSSWVRATGISHSAGYFQDSWHHVACRYDEATQTLDVIVDGQVEGSLASPRGWLSLETLKEQVGPDALTGGSDDAFYIGQAVDYRLNSYQFFGEMDEFALYQRAVPDDELRQHFRNGNPGCFALGTQDDPALSCDALASQAFASGFYYVQNAAGTGSVLVWCAMDFGSGGWARVGKNFSLAAIYTDPSNPTNWQQPSVVAKGGVSLNRNPSDPFEFEFVSDDDFALLQQLRIDELAVDSDLQLFTGMDDATNPEAAIRVRFWDDLATEKVIKHSVTNQDDQDIVLMAGGDRVLCRDVLPSASNGCGTAGSANTGASGVPSQLLVLASARFLPNCPSCTFAGGLVHRNEFWAIGSRYFVGVKTHSECPSRLAQWHAFDDRSHPHKAKRGQDAVIHFDAPPAKWDLGAHTPERQVRFSNASWVDLCPASLSAACLNRDDPTNSQDVTAVLQDGDKLTSASHRSGQMLAQTLEIRLDQVSSVSALRIRVEAGMIPSANSPARTPKYGGFGGVRISTAGKDRVFEERHTDDRLFGRCFNNWKFSCSPARLAAVGSGLGPIFTDTTAYNHFQTFANNYGSYWDGFTTISDDFAEDGFEMSPARGWRTFELPETVPDVAFIRLQFGTVSVLVANGEPGCAVSNGCQGNSVAVSELRVINGREDKPTLRWSQRSKAGEGKALSKDQHIDGTAHGFAVNCVSYSGTLSQCLRTCESVAECNGVNYSTGGGCCMKKISNPFISEAVDYPSSALWQSWVLLPVVSGTQAANEPELGSALYLSNTQTEQGEAGEFGWSFDQDSGQPLPGNWFKEPRQAWLETARLPFERSFSLSFWVRIDAVNYYHQEMLFSVHEPAFVRSIGMMIQTNGYPHTNMQLTLPNLVTGGTASYGDFSSPLETGVWHHFVLRATQTGATNHSVDLFRDGRALVTGMQSQTHQNFAGLLSWNHHYPGGGGAGSARMQMALDEMRVYDSALSDCQIMALNQNVRDPHQNGGGFAGMPVCPPSNPSQASVTGGARCSEALVTFSGAVSQLRGEPWYVIAAYDQTEEVQGINRMVATESPALVTGLTCGKNYRFVISAQDDAGTSNTIAADFETPAQPQCAASPSSMMRWCSRRQFKY